MTEINPAFTTDPSNIIFTQNAATKVYELIEEENNFKLNLRVYVTGGGCSGFKYGFTFDEQVNTDDAIVKQNSLSGNEVKLLVDSLSYQYLVGAEIDYKKDLEGEQFIIRNPKAKTTCGCGSSFSTE